MLTLTLILIYMGEDLTAFRLPKVAVFLTTPFSSKLGGYAELADRYRRALIWLWWLDLNQQFSPTKGAFNQRKIVSVELTLNRQAG
jgi:hypothetical protein